MSLEKKSWWVDLQLARHVCKCLPSCSVFFKTRRGHGFDSDHFLVFLVICFWSPQRFLTISKIHLNKKRFFSLLSHFSPSPFVCVCVCVCSERCYESLHLRYYDNGESWGRIHLRSVEQCSCQAGEVQCRRVRYTGKNQLLLTSQRFHTFTNRNNSY